MKVIVALNRYVRGNNKIFRFGGSIVAHASKHLVAASGASLVVVGVVCGFCDLGAAHISLIVLELVILILCIEEFIRGVTVKNGLFTREDLFTNCTEGICGKSRRITGTVYLIVSNGNTGMRVVLCFERGPLSCHIGGKLADQSESIGFNTVVIFNLCLIWHLCRNNTAVIQSSVTIFKNVKRYVRKAIFNTAGKGLVAGIYHFGNMSDLGNAACPIS